MKNTHNSESGNALWFILIGIVLLAALTITISRSSDTAEQSGDIERYRIQASEILGFAVSTEEAINRMGLNGISENLLSFEISFLSAAYNNASCTDNDCLIFNVEGGGISYETPDETALDTANSAEFHYAEWYFPSQVCVSNIGDGAAGCESDGIANEDLIAVLPWIKKGVCIEINKILDVTNPGGEPPVNDDDAFDNSYPVYTGSFTSEDGVILDAALNLDGERSGCFEGSGVPPADTYHFYHVLRAR